MQLEGTIIRVACNQASRTDFVNALDGQTPIIPRACSVVIPCAVFIDDPGLEANLITDLGNIVTANCVMRAGSAAGTVFFEQVIPAAGFNPGLTHAQWAANTAAHFTFALTPTDSNLAAGPLYIAIGVTTSNAGNISLVYCSNAEVKDYGIYNAETPGTPDYTSWSKAEADGRYAPVGSAGLATNVTNVGGDTAHSLERIATVDLALPALRTALIGADAARARLQFWVLRAGTDANDADHQRPSDYHTTANPRIWERKG